MDCSLLGFAINGIFQARVLEWVAISFSRGSSRPRDRIQVSLIVGRCFTLWATREAYVAHKNTCLLDLHLYLHSGLIIKWTGLISKSIPGLGKSTEEGIGYSHQYSWTSLVAQLVKNLPAMWETWVRSLGWEGESNPLQYSGLKNSMDCIVHGGCKELDTTEWLLLHSQWMCKFPQSYLIEGIAMENKRSINT